MTQPASQKRILQVPWVTLGLILANLLASLLATLDSNAALDFSFNPTDPSVKTGITSLFFHANLIHLLGNMVFLAAVGPRVESVAGRLRYALIYFVGGLVGVLAHLIVMQAIHSSTPVMGASGAIAACAGYCSVRFMNRRVPLAPKLTVTVGTVTLVWVGLQALGAFVRMGQSEASGTAFWTHLAGFAAGLALSVVFSAPKQARLQFGHDVLDQMTERGPAALLQATEQHLVAHPGDPRALRDMATALHQMGERDREAETLVLLLDAVPTASQPPVLMDLEESGGLSRLAPLRRMKLAEAHAQAHTALAKRLIRSVVDDPAAEAMRPDALLALALLEEDEAQSSLVRELVERYPLHAASEIAKSRGLVR